LDRQAQWRHILKNKPRKTKSEGQAFRVSLVKPVAYLSASYFVETPKNAIQAVKEIEKNIKEGYVHIYDADLSKYFDSIPHQRLMEKLSRRISDQEILRILQEMIKAPVIEVTEKGKRKNIANEEKGVPQGNVCSPLMANIYLNDFCCKIAGKTPCKIIT